MRMGDGRGVEAQPLPKAALESKRQLGSRLDSGATAGEGTQNLLCAAQSAAVLIGLAITAASGRVWVAPLVAMLLGIWAFDEGLKAWRGEQCR